MTALRENAISILRESIPEENIQQVYEILITFVNRSDKTKKKHYAKGALKGYADSSKWPMEEGAFERAMVKKHEIG